MIRKRHNAARKIQKQWKFYKLYHFKDIVRTKEQNKASFSIQKYLKGLIIAKQYEEFYVKMRLDDNLDYFQGMKDKIYDDAQKLIAKYWRLKLERLRAKRKGEKRDRPRAHAKKKSVQSKVKPYIDGNRNANSSSKNRATG